MTIGSWPAKKKNRMAPANVHEKATRSTFNPRGFRVQDEDAAKPGPVRWIMRDGKPVDERGNQRKPIPGG